MDFGWVLIEFNGFWMDFDIYVQWLLIDFGWVMIDFGWVMMDFGWILGGFWMGFE